MSKNQRRLTLTVEEAGALLGVGRSTAYELVRSGEISSIRLRRRIVVPLARLAERLGMSASELQAIVHEGATEADARAGTSRDVDPPTLF